jgi:hypothetical protein
MACLRSGVILSHIHRDSPQHDRQNDRQLAAALGNTVGTSAASYCLSDALAKTTEALAIIELVLHALICASGEGRCHLHRNLCV